MKKRISKKLIELATNKKMIAYSDLALQCKIPYNNINERETMHDILGEISTHEVNNGRPMLSVLVHHKADLERSAGIGWFKLADKLKQRRDKECDLIMRLRVLADCWKYWDKEIKKKEQKNEN